MKKPKFFVIAVLSVGFASIAIPQAERLDAADDVYGTMTKANGVVVKVYSARQDVAEYRAYVVKWNGSEIVVDDMPGIGQRTYEVGDTISFTVHRIDLKRKDPKGILNFVINPELKESGKK